MAPRSFSTDGAAGGWSGGAGTSSGGALGADIMNDPGTPGTTHAGVALNPFTAGDFGTTNAPPGSEAASFAPTSGGGYGFNPADNAAYQHAAATSTPGVKAPWAGAGNVTPENASAYAAAAGAGGPGFSFADGGAVPDDTDGSPEQDMMAKALESVDKTLQYTYQKYGLGGGNQESGGAINTAGMMPTIPGNQSETPGPYVPQQPKPQQMAANMPTIPGSQSNSGVPPQQPMPGPLPPTSNPFGKRADNDSDDRSAAIDTDEDTA